MVQKSSPKQDFFSQESTTHALTYFPYLIGPIAMFLLASTHKKKLFVHIKYSSFFAIVAILLHIFVSWSILWWLIFPWYVVLSWFLAYKAYSGEKIQIDFIDTLEDKVQEKIKK